MSLRVTVRYSVGSRVEVKNLVSVGHSLQRMCLKTKILVLKFALFCYTFVFIHLNFDKMHYFPQHIGARYLVMGRKI